MWQSQDSNPDHEAPEPAGLTAMLRLLLWITTNKFPCIWLIQVHRRGPNPHISYKIMEIPECWSLRKTLVFPFGLHLYRSQGKKPPQKNPRKNCTMSLKAQKHWDLPRGFDHKWAESAPKSVLENFQCEDLQWKIRGSKVGLMFYTF